MFGQGVAFKYVRFGVIDDFEPLIANRWKRAALHVFVFHKEAENACIRIPIKPWQIREIELDQEHHWLARFVNWPLCAIWQARTATNGGMRIRPHCSINNIQRYAGLFLHFRKLSGFADNCGPVARVIRARFAAFRSRYRGVFLGQMLPMEIVPDSNEHEQNDDLNCQWVRPLFLVLANPSLRPFPSQRKSSPSRYPDHSASHKQGSAADRPPAATSSHQRSRAAFLSRLLPMGLADQSHISS